MSVFKSTRLLSVLALSTSLILTGCATTGSQLLGGSSADERLTRGEDASFFNRSGLQACAAGAAISIAACMLTNSSNKAACMVVAGIAACGVALGANYYLDQRRSEFADTNERLQAITGDVQADTQRIMTRTEAAKAVISDDKKAIALLQKNIKSNELDIDKAEQELSQIDSNLKILNNDLKNMNSRLTNFEEVAAKERADGASGRSLQTLDKEISQMRSQIAFLQMEVDVLYNARSAITLG